MDVPRIVKSVIGLSKTSCRLKGSPKAVMYLRAGGDAYSLQYLLGHSDMTVTRMYVKLAAVDVIEMYKSPLDRL